VKPASFVPQRSHTAVSHRTGTQNGLLVGLRYWH